MRKRLDAGVDGGAFGRIVEQPRVLEGSLRNWRSSESITQATSRTQQITLASGNSRISAGNFADHARLVSKITGASRSA